MSNESVPGDPTPPPQPAEGDTRSDDDTLTDAPFVRSHPRLQQLFPVLTEAELSRVRRFGRVSRYPKGAMLYRVGERTPGMFVLLSGKIRAVARDGLGREQIIHTFTQRGEFTSDVNQFSNKPSFVDSCVIEDVEAVLVRPDDLSPLLTGEAELGEKIMRALILRRFVAMERVNGAVLVGVTGNPRLLALQNFLRRNTYPNVTLDAEQDAGSVALLEGLTPRPDDFPLVICPNGTVLRNPDEGQLASCLGLIPDFDPAHVYDVAIVGAGPAGLAAAVYAASEGMSVAVLDCRAPGGQAGASARIENFFGFPTGITGHALADRAFVQAQKFGAHIGIPCEVKALYCDRQPPVVELTDGHRITARTVVIATGAEYRRPVVEDLERFEGRGVYYWATPIEAKLCRNEPVMLIGGGNSAGQAVVFLASHAEHVHMFIRGAKLEDSMSHYLVERVTSLPNVTVHTRVELTALEGTGRLERVHYRGAGGIEGSMTIHHLFVFIGADPNTRWLNTCGISLDSKGFVQTGIDPPDANMLSISLQTSVEGVFAIGDVRSGSTKRVASAVGEGAGVVAQIQVFLSRAY
ncbi:FAD-dependent oxidoreductase [Paraburkholderia caribensis]|jgi:thioredoxin reductase (NADPH)|uniref:FAD-dependent oxidoreductase n=1 Tax=Paraburkholderia caribensis TaxID=75105 RepID=UPI001CB2C614|nr:FAD-dependent oxidoreductase [Paraburkholderia caribensis]CAG9242903.1 Thioredoxin reductase [Paraburkholderia caribensis]